MEEQIDYKRLVEAALFMSPNALSAQDLSGITGIKSIGHIEQMLAELKAEYASRETSLEVIEIDKKYMLSLREPYASRVSQLASGPDITKGALKVLAYISQNNNTMQSYLVKVFGASTYDHVKELIEHGFIERKKRGRSWRISTTNKFREYFNAPPSRSDETP
ncbi:MAG: SMC-Scp complex subunit ScpB [Candidatus Marsarchaeota archaeon]|nr:SMC-Scp complex subunit ScpB [Candidatus Marsarchaeota archaeon]